MEINKGVYVKVEVNKGAVPSIKDKTGLSKGFKFAVNWEDDGLQKILFGWDEFIFKYETIEEVLEKLAQIGRLNPGLIKNIKIRNDD